MKTLTLVMLLLVAPIAWGADPADALRGCRGTYEHEPLAADGRVDIAELVRELVDQHVNTYVWSMPKELTGLGDFKTFVEAAKAHQIRVWAGFGPKHRPLTDPYPYDLRQWVTGLAKIGVDDPNLVGWTIDDFSHYPTVFTPQEMAAVQAAAHQIDPNLLFVPCCYYTDIVVKQKNFFQDYRDSLGGVLFPYRHESQVWNLKDPSLATPEIIKLKQLAGPVPIVLDVYATAHSVLGATTPDYVRSVMEQGKANADGVMIYCHQSPTKEADKYKVIRELYTKWADQRQ